MAYTVDWTSNNVEGIPFKGPIPVPDKAIVSNATSLVLTGKNLQDFGEYQQENFIRMLENFASENPPAFPTIGQLWYDTVDEALKICKSKDDIASGNWTIIMDTFNDGGGTVTSVNATSSTLTITGGPIEDNGTFVINMPNTGVTVGSYTRANITVDAQGRITSASNGPAVTSVSASGTQGVSVSVSNPTTTPALTIGLGAITPTSVAATGTVTGSNISPSTVVSGTNTGDQTITLTGDVTGSGTGTFTATLSNTGVPNGTYTFANITVDSKGRITGASSGSPVTSVNGSGGSTGLTLSGGPITSTGTLTIGGTLAVTSGGTGATDAAGARSNLGLVIGSNVPSPTGTGASGTWNININGNAATAGSATSATNATNLISGGTIASSVTGVTQTSGTNNATLATTAFVQAAVAGSTGVAMYSYRSSAGVKGTDDAWTTFPLNTTDFSNIPGASRTGGNITLPAGTYIMQAKSTVQIGDNNQVRILVGASEWRGSFAFNRGGDGNNGTTRFCDAIFTIGSPTVIQYQYYKNDDNLMDGNAGSNGASNNTIASIVIQKVG